MHCTNCGQELPEDSRICQCCGASQAEEIVDEATAKLSGQIPTPEPMEETEREPLPEDVWESKPMELNLEGEVAETPKKKKKKIVLIVSAVVALLLLVVGLIGFLALDWGLYIRDFFQRRKDPEEYKNIVEERAIEDQGLSELGIVKRLLLNAYSDNRELAEKGGREVTVELQLDSQMRSLLELVMAGDADSLAQLDSLGTVDLTFVSADAGDKIQGTLKVALEDDHLITLDVVLDVEEDALYLTIPEVNETALMIPLEDAPPILQDFARSQQTNQAWNEFVLRCPDEETLAATIDQFLIAAVHEIDNVEMNTDGELEASGVSQGATVLTYDITDKTVQNMVIAMLETARNDDQMMDLLDNYNQLAEDINRINPEAEPLPTLEGESVDQTIENVKAWETTGETLLTVDTYVNRKGQISGRTYRLENGELEISYRVAMRGFEGGVEVLVEYDGVEISLAGSVEYDDGALSGEAAMKVDDWDLLAFQITDIPLKGRGGSVLMKPGSYAQELLSKETGLSETLLDFADLGLEMTFAEDTTTISLKSGSTDVLNVTAKEEIVEAQPVALPEQSTEEPLVWLLSMDAKELVGILEKLGLDDQIIDLILEEFLGSILSAA